MERITTGQFGEMIALFAKKLPLTMPKGSAQEQGTAQYWIDKPHLFEAAIVEALMPKAIVASEVNPETIQPASALPSFFRAADTNLEKAIDLAQRFSKEILGVEVDLRKLFNLPTGLPWKNVLLVFDPGFDNHTAVEKAIKGQGLSEWEETDLMKYLGSAKWATPTLHIIENTIRPSEDTLGESAKSPDQLVADGRSYLELRGYALAFGQRYFGFKDYLDSETWTWFPKNRLPDGNVAYGRCDPGYREVRFYWNDPGRRDSSSGARLAMSVPLIP